MTTKTLTPKERQRLHRQKRRLAGYHLIHVDLPPDAAEALETIMQERGCSQATAVADALMHFADVGA